MGFDIAAAFGGADLLGGLFGAGAEVAPELAAGADVLGAGAGDVLASGAAADLGVLGGAADVGALGGATDLAAAGGAGAADLGALGFAAPTAAAAGDLAAGGGALVGDVTAGLGAGAGIAGADLPANAAAIAGTAINPGVGGAIPATLGGGADLAGGVLPASSALPLPGSVGDVTSLSGMNVANLADPNVVTDVPTVDLGYTGLDAPTNLGATGGGGGAADTTGAFDATAASDSSAIGGGGGAPASIPADATGTVPPSPLASQADISGGMLGQGGGAQAGAAGTTLAPSGAAGGARAAAGGAGGAGGGGFDWWKAAGLGLGAAPLALTLMRGQQQMPEQGLQSGALSNQVGAAGSQLLQQAMAGQVTPGQQATLNLDRQRMINQARQQLFNQGISPENSSAWGGIMANIDQQIAAEQQQFLTANINEAFQGTGQAQGNLTSLAQQQIALDNAYTQAIANAGRSVGGLFGQSGTRIL